MKDKMIIKDNLGDEGQGGGSKSHNIVGDFGCND